MVPQQNIGKFKFGESRGRARQIVCENCGVEVKLFVSTVARGNWKRRHCSFECYQVTRFKARTGVVRACERCGDPYYVGRSEIKRHPGYRYCSYQCRYPNKREIRAPNRRFTGDVSAVIVRRAFKESGLSKCQLARKMGLYRRLPNTTRINQILGQGQKRVSLETAAAVFAALNQTFKTPTVLVKNAIASGAADWGAIIAATKLREDSVGDALAELLELRQIRIDRTGSRRRFVIMK